MLAIKKHCNKIKDDFGGLINGQTINMEWNSKLEDMSTETSPNYNAKRKQKYNIQGLWDN